MAVRDNKNITLVVIGVLEAGTLIFVLDFIDQSVKAANDILRGSAREWKLAWKDCTRTTFNA